MKCKCPHCNEEIEVTYSSLESQFLVETDRNFTAYVESPEGVDTLCHFLINDYEDEIEAGTYTKMDLHRDCDEHVTKIWNKYRTVMTSCAITLEMFEESVNIWQHVKDDQKKRIVGDVLHAVKDVIEFIELMGVEIPSPLN